MTVRLLDNGRRVGQLPLMGVQDLLPPNAAPWHTEDFKLREFEKMADAGRSP